MPGKSHDDASPLSTTERRLADDLRVHVYTLAGDIGERNMKESDALAAARDYIVGDFEDAGFSPALHAYRLGDAHGGAFAGETATNIIAEVPGSERPDEIVILGAHYDSIFGSPGANDNASGVAVLLELAHHFADRPLPRTVRFVAFVNEEPPFFQTPDMGSYAYARELAEQGTEVTAMIAFDGLGYFDTAAGSQQYPVPGLGLIYGDRGDFIAFITRFSDGRLLRQVIRAFREQATIPSEGAALPGAIGPVGWSDHWAFWQVDYPALFITDTLPFRDPHYHLPTDTADRLDYEHMARLTTGMKHVIKRLATP